MILASIHSRIGHFLQRRNQADNFLSLRLSMLFHPSSNTTTHPKVQKKSRFPSHASALICNPNGVVPFPAFVHHRAHAAIPFGRLHSPRFLNQRSPPVVARSIHPQLVARVSRR